MDIEKVTNLDDSKVPAYFESIKSVFFTKVLLFSVHKKDDSLIIPIADDVSKTMKDTFPEYDLYEKAILRGNKEIMDNYNDDIYNSLIITSWVAFELVIKDLTKKDYSLCADDISVDYKENIFGLEDREKKDLDLFYYIRNAFVHYNGAYFSYRLIDHTYNGHSFKSTGHEGEKINIPDMQTAYAIHLDLEKYAYKAWNNYQKYRSK